VAAVWVPILGWLQLRGALGAAIDATFLHNLAYAGALPVSRRVELLTAYGAPLLRSQAIVWMLAALGAALLASRRERFAAYFLGGWALANAAGVSVGGNFFPHYFQQLLPAVAALAAVAVSGTRASLASSRWRVAALGGFALAPLVWTTITFWMLSPAAAIQRIYPQNSFASMPMLAHEIELLTDADDTVFVFGTEPEILFDARRASATRYIYLFPVFGRFPNALERQQEVIDEVSSSRPRVMLWLPNQMFFAEGAPQLLTSWFQRVAARDYHVYAFRVSGRDGGMELLRVPPGVNPNAVLGSRKPSATLFVRNEDDREPR